MKLTTAFLAWLLLATQLFADTERWVGKAQDVAQRDTITFGGTWAATETASLVCNSKTITVTGGASLDTPAEYAAAFVELVNSADHVASRIDADATFNAGGYEFGEFRDMVASLDPADATVVWLTSATPGVPFDVTVAEGSTSGTITLLSDGSGDSILATGKNWFDAGANWSDGTVPDDDDDILFSGATPSVLYGLNNTTLQDLDIVIKPDYTGLIGLEENNVLHNGFPYREYRTRYLNLLATVTTGAQSSEIGDKNSATQPKGKYYIDFNTVDGSSCSIVVYGAKYLEIGGGVDLNATVVSGIVVLGTATTATNTNGVSVRGGDVTLTQYVTLDDDTEYSVYGGTLKSYATEAGANNPEMTVKMGRLEWNAGEMNALNIWEGGHVIYDGGTVTTVNVYKDGVFSAGRTAFTATNLNLFGGATYNDPNGEITLTNGIDLEGCEFSELKAISVQKNQTWTPSAL